MVADYNSKIFRPKLKTFKFTMTDGCHIGKRRFRQRIVPFYRRDAMLARVIAIATCRSVCPPVRPSVRPSVTRRYCVKTNEKKLAA